MKRVSIEVVFLCLAAGLLGWAIGHIAGEDTCTLQPEYQVLERKYKDLVLQKEAQDTVWRENLAAILAASQVDQTHLEACLEELAR